MITNILVIRKWAYWKVGFMLNPVVISWIWAINCCIVTNNRIYIFFLLLLVVLIYLVY
jgi:hypothetical protein